MMWDRDPQIQENGFGFLQKYTAEFADELIDEFQKDQEPRLRDWQQHGMKCWLLELIGEARSPKAFDFLCQQLQSPDVSFQDWALRALENLDTKESRTFLWEFENGKRE